MAYSNFSNSSWALYLPRLKGGTGVYLEQAAIRDRPLCLISHALRALMLCCSNKPSCFHPPSACGWNLLVQLFYQSKTMCLLEKAKKGESIAWPHCHIYWHFAENCALLYKKCVIYFLHFTSDHICSLFYLNAVFNWSSSFKALNFSLIRVLPLTWLRWSYEIFIVFIRRAMTL